MKCNKCGAEIPGDSVFCPECGIRIESTDCGIGSTKWKRMATWFFVAVPLLVFKLISSIFIAPRYIGDCIYLGFPGCAYMIANFCATVIISIILCCFFLKLDKTNQSLPDGIKVFKSIGFVALFEAAVYIAISFLPRFSVAWFVMIIVDFVLLATYLIIAILAVKQIKGKSKSIKLTDDLMMKAIGDRLIIHCICLLFYLIHVIILFVGWLTPLFSPLFRYIALVPSIIFELVFMILLGLTLKKYENEAL